MLNDKEKELKAAVREIDSSKKKVQDIMDSKAENDKPQTAKSVKTQASAKVVNQPQTTQKNKSVKPDSRPAEMPQEVSTINELSSNNNSQILTLYTQGRSVVEISKLLGLGQGEVKLVIDLFKGKK
jgi:DNA-binding NarL/FixJ family response regulator